MHLVSLTRYLKYKYSSIKIDIQRPKGYSLFFFVFFGGAHHGSQSRCVVFKFHSSKKVRNKTKVLSVQLGKTYSLYELR